jgi:hypothetical protein
MTVTPCLFAILSVIATLLLGVSTMLFVGIKNNLLIEKPPLIIHRSVAFVNRDLSMFPT